MAATSNLGKHMVGVEDPTWLACGVRLLHNGLWGEERILPAQDCSRLVLIASYCDAQFLKCKDDVAHKRHYPGIRS